MLRILCIFLVYDCLAVPVAIREQALKWFDIQKQFVSCSHELKISLKEQNKENLEFFKLQHQIAAIYQAQKRYKLGFGTAILPTTNAVREYLRKKTFLQLKTKEIIPIYRAVANSYQLKCTNAHVEKKIKQLKQFEALNILHAKLFEESLQNNSKQLLKFDKSKRVDSIAAVSKKFLKSIKLKASDQDWNWSNPVAGTFEIRNNAVFWHSSLDKNIVLAPTGGVVTFVGEFESNTAIVISNHAYDYVLMGADKVLVTVGEFIKHKDPIGTYEAKTSEELLQLRLYKDYVQLDPSPYLVKDM